MLNMTKNIYLVALGALLRDQRSRIKFTQVHVARNSGISPSLYSLVENGIQIPSKPVLMNIASALQVDASVVKQLELLIAKVKGLPDEDSGLPDEVQALMLEIRQSASFLPTHFVNALRREIHELAK